MTPFDIVLVSFPFSDLSTKKLRPCLVLATVRTRALSNLAVVAMMTSQIEGRRFPHDVMVSKWQESGLPKATLVRLAKVVTLEQSMVHKTLGKLDKKDRQAVRTHLGELFSAVL